MAVNQMHRCEVREVLRIGPKVVKVSLDPGEEHRAQWLSVPGGYVTFNLPTSPRLQRCYSLVSAPNDPYPRVVVKEIPGGKGSAFFNRELRPGMQLDVSPPKTRLHEPWMDDKPRHWIFFGAGIGVTPLLGLARHALAQNHPNRVTLFLGNRNMKSIPLYNACEALAAHPRARVRHILTDGSMDDVRYNGRITSDKTRELLGGLMTSRTGELPSDFLGFVSGPQPMMESVRKGWVEAGLPWHKLRAERFHFPPAMAWAGESPSVQRAQVSFRRGREEWNVSIEAGPKSILSAAIDAGVPVKHQCRGGVCGTCKARLIFGQVDTDKPLQGDQILCCQSRPQSNSIVVELP